MLGDKIIGYIRTYVPMGVGAVATWLFTKYGIDVTEEYVLEISIGLTALAGAIYYGLVRVVVEVWPKWEWAGTFLGYNVAAKYNEKSKKTNYDALGNPIAVE